MKKEVYEVCFYGCTPYSKIVKGYYGLKGIIYNSKNEKVDQEEINMRDLSISNT